MRKIIEAQDILADARHCVDCIYFAALDLDEKAGAFTCVADIASKKIAAAIALLDEYVKVSDAGPGADLEAATCEPL